MEFLVEHSHPQWTKATWGAQAHKFYFYLFKFSEDNTAGTYAYQM